MAKFGDQFSDVQLEVGADIRSLPLFPLMFRSPALSTRVRLVGFTYLTEINCQYLLQSY